MVNATLLNNLGNFNKLLSFKSMPSNVNNKKQNASEREKLCQAINPIKIEYFGLEHDVFFTKEILTPYLSSVYFSMVSRGKKNYLCTKRMK